MYFEFSVVVGTTLWWLAVYPWWPWDFKGKRKHINLSKRKDGWDE